MPLCGSHSAGKRYSLFEIMVQRYEKRLKRKSKTCFFYNLSFFLPVLSQGLRVCKQKSKRPAKRSHAGNEMFPRWGQNIPTLGTN
jgi:hypothetical protein